MVRNVTSARRCPHSKSSRRGYERLVEAARVKGWRTHLIVLLGGDAGLRAGEMVALHWSDVDFARRRLCVRHSDWRGSLPAPNSGRVRYVPLTERLLDALREYRHLRGARVLCKDDGAPLRCTSCVTRSARTWRCRAPSVAIQGLAGHQEMSVEAGGTRSKACV
jgi:integrase